MKLVLSLTDNFFSDFINEFLAIKLVIRRLHDQGYVYWILFILTNDSREL